MGGHGVGGRDLARPHDEGAQGWVVLDGPPPAAWNLKSPVQSAGRSGGCPSSDVAAASVCVIRQPMKRAGEWCPWLAGHGSSVWPRGWAAAPQPPWGASRASRPALPSEPSLLQLFPPPLPRPRPSDFITNSPGRGTWTRVMRAPKVVLGVEALVC